ncbi:TIGR01621 family pseudouridine synthase [Aliikangiella marina]|uniref:TIGR01621 family pseudouridine synthase n=1 Tax=Aliikangiella marina TaxID=1712262 RepID=A0A545TH37_9GAMM|nr:TIGR01621 family pseudouridine synthase [Aliikangiella marina]TQV76542.1 TIGR01621 family pseudouridine synthase [Aliikangiella marina]
MEYQILLNNSDFIAINKPAGVNFHTEDDQPGIAALLEKSLSCDLFPVHRLDKMTSGVLLFAKSQNAARDLSRLFANKNVFKKYLAISAKKPKKKQGKVIGDMVKARNGSWKLTHSRDNPAITQFTSRALVPGIRVFWVTPTTGKTHQIRVALKSIGSPILGDVRYGASEADRGYLHAYQIQFAWRGDDIKITCTPDTGELFDHQNLKTILAGFESLDT